MKLSEFMSSMVSEDSKISHKRVIVVLAAGTFFLLIAPICMWFGKHLDDNITQVYMWVIIGGMGTSAAVSIGNAMAAAKGKSADTPDPVTPDINVTQINQPDQP